MLLFIRVVQAKKAWYNYISIHLMLLFIFLFFQQRYQHLKFQYISCYCLSSFFVSVVCSSFDFNTSHVTVYPITIDTKRFQFCDFNTSHVTVYLMHFLSPSPLPAFQYISCYCLSNELTPFYIFLRI